MITSKHIILTETRELLMKLFSPEEEEGSTRKEKARKRYQERGRKAGLKGFYKNGSIKLYLIEKGTDSFGDNLVSLFVNKEFDRDYNVNSDELLKAVDRAMSRIGMVIHLKDQEFNSLSEFLDVGSWFLTKEYNEKKQRYFDNDDYVQGGERYKKEDWPYATLEGDDTKVYLDEVTCSCGLCEKDWVLGNIYVGDVLLVDEALPVFVDVDKNSYDYNKVRSDLSILGDLSMLNPLLEIRVDSKESVNNSAPYTINILGIGWKPTGKGVYDEWTLASEYCHTVDNYTLDDLLEAIPFYGAGYSWSKPKRFSKLYEVINEAFKKDSLTNVESCIYKIYMNGNNPEMKRVGSGEVCTYEEYKDILVPIVNVLLELNKKVGEAYIILEKNSVYAGGFVTGNYRYRKNEATGEYVVTVW